MNYAQGAIQWASADPATTTYTVNLPAGFALKALRFEVQGLGSASDAVSEAAHSRRSVGFATSTSLRRAVASYDQDAADPMTCASILRDDCIAATVGGTAATTGLLDITTFSAEQFVLTVDDAAPANLTVFWRAWGGSDITVATIVDIAEPAAIGVQTYTVTGFTSGATDQVVMLAGVQSAAAANTGANTSSGLYAGYATGTATTANICVTGNSVDNATTANTDGAGRAGQCIIMPAVAGDTINARAALTQWNAGNFGIDWAEVGLTDRRSIALCLKGGQWAAGGLTIDGSTLNATATVSGLAFAPIGVNLIGAMVAESANNAVHAFDRMAWGGGTSTTDRHSMGHWSESGTGTANVNLTLQYDQVLAYPSSTGTLATAYDLNAMNSDGFQIMNDLAGGVASEWIGYLAFGSAAGGAALAATPAAVAAATAAMTAAIQLAGAAVSVASGSGALSTQIPLEAAALSVAGAGAGLTASIAFQAAALLQASATAGLATEVLLAAAAAAEAAGNAALATDIRLAAAAQGNASATAEFAGTAAALAAAAQASASASAQLDAQIQLAAAAQAAATAATDLTVQIRLAAVATGTAAASGDLASQVLLAAAAATAASGGGTLTAQITLSAAALVQAAATGVLVTQIRLVADAAASATGTAQLVVAVAAPTVNLTVRPRPRALAVHGHPRTVPAFKRAA